LKGKLAQSEANLEAAHATRKSLEKELEGRVAPPSGNPDDAALQELLTEQEQQVTQSRTTIAELEARVAELQERCDVLSAAQTAQSPEEGSSNEESATLKESLRDQERRAASWEEKVQEMEAELLATTRSHEEAQRELERLREAAASGDGDEALAIELELMTRERNELAAELAVLKAEKGS
jgi:phage shock protein A